MEISYGRAIDQVCLGDAGQRHEVVAHPLADLLQRPLVDVAGHRDVDHLAAQHHLLDHRLLGLVGEGVDGVDPRS